MANEFGKDLGLVHEAVVTGRKVNAGTAFWNALAESVKAFNLVEPLARHAAIVDKFGIHGEIIPDEQKIEQFGEWLHDVTGGCITCILADANLERLGINKPSGFDSKTHNEQREITQGMHKEARREVKRKIMEMLDVLHVHPAEVGIFIGSSAWQWIENDLHLDDQCCISDSKVTNALKTVRIQRQFMAAMQNTDRK